MSSLYSVKINSNQAIPDVLVKRPLNVSFYSWGYSPTQRRAAVFEALLKYILKVFHVSPKFNRKSALKRSLEIATYLNTTLNKL